MPSKKLQRLTLSALFGSLTALLALINLPLPFTDIVFSMAVTGVFLSGGLLLPRYALLSQLVYIGLGVLGLPVFSKGQAGIAVLIGPTGGYLFSYPVMALIISLLLRRVSARFTLKTAAALILSIIICYFLGTLWFSFLQKTSPFLALTVTALPFIPFDLAKAAICTVLIVSLRKRLDLYG